MATLYNLRLTPLDGQDVVDEIKQLLDHHATGYVVCREHATNMHYHVVFNSDAKRDALNKFIRRKCAGKIGAGNAGAGFNDEKIKDPDALFRYVCKGGGPFHTDRSQPPDIVFFHRLCEDKDAWVHQKWQEYWAEHDNLKRKRTEDRKQPLSEYMNDWAEQCQISRHEDFRRAACEEYIRLCVQQKRPINVFHGKGLVNLLCATRFDDARFELAEKLFSM